MAPLEMNALDRDAAAWLSAAIAEVDDAVLGADLKGIIQFLNPAAEALLELSSATAVGNLAMSALHFGHDRTSKTISNPLVESLRQKTAVSILPNTCLRNSNGREILIEGQARPVRSTEGEIIGSLLVFRDQAARRRLEEDLRQAQASTDLGHLRNGIAHDFNNLMTVVIGFADVLLTKLQKGDSPAGFGESLIEIKSSAERAAFLSQQLLALGRSRQAEIGPVDLNELLASAEKTLGRILGERIQISTQQARELPLVLIDSVQMLQAIFQLATNAREAMPEGGIIHFATRRRESGGSGSGPMVEISVTDTGVGMDPHTLGKALEPLFTTKEGARGLGLSVVASSLRNWGGDIHLESTPGIGTKAIMTLPAGNQPTLRNGAPPPEAITKATCGTVVLVEDADRVRKLLARVLEDAGFTVLQAADGRAGLELCQARRGEIQLLITDVIMPEMSGPELVRALEDRNALPRVLFLSGYAGDALDREGLDPKRYHFLQKPFLGDALLSKVREALASEKKTVSSESLVDKTQ